MMGEDRNGLLKGLEAARQAERPFKLPREIGNDGRGQNGHPKGLEAARQT